MGDWNVKNKPFWLCLRARFTPIATTIRKLHSIFRRLLAVMLVQDEVAGHRHYPLSTHPELSVIEYPGFREYRVENPGLVMKSGNGLQKLVSATLTSMFLIPLLAFCWQSVNIDILLPKLWI
jgi:hypothetical protein